MHPAVLQRLQEAFRTQALWQERNSVLTAAVLAGGGATLTEPDSPVRRLCARYMQVTSDQAPTPARSLIYAGALHYLALSGQAPGFARFCASCGGRYDPAADREAAVAAALAVTRRQADDVLDFMLSYPTPQTNEVARSAALVLGALAAVRRFPGPLALLELGCSAGLNLLFDHYGYDYGGGLTRPGPAELTLAAELRGNRAAAAPLLQLETSVVSRTGIDLRPMDVMHGPDVQVLKAFVFPDQADRHVRFDAAVAAARAYLGAGGRLDLRQGDMSSLLAEVLPEVYAAMPADTTLLVYHSVATSYLPDAPRTRLEAAIQTFSTRLERGKPLAWLQCEPARFGQLEEPELRLMTFSPDDPEDRDILPLGRAHYHARWIEWEG